MRTNNLPFGQVGKALSIAVPGGALFSLLNVPLAWMLGPLAAVIAARFILHIPVFWPVSLRNTALLALGYTMGSPFTWQTAASIWSHLPVMLLSTLLTVGFSLILGLVVSKQTGISLASSIVGSVPGGLTQMVVVAEEIRGADLTVVTFLQTFRMLAVVFVIPFLAVHGMMGSPAVVSSSSAIAGAWDMGSLMKFGVAVIVGALFAHKIGLPTPYMLGPVLGTAVLVMSGVQAPPLPRFVIILAQISMGLFMGMNIRPAKMREMRGLVFYGLVSAAMLVLFSLLLGWQLGNLYPISATTGFLSTAPGGMAEMGLTALLVQADLSSVISFQMFRLLFILLAVPPILRLWLGRS